MPLQGRINGLRLVISENIVFESANRPGPGKHDGCSEGSNLQTLHSLVQVAANYIIPEATNSTCPSPR